MSSAPRLCGFAWCVVAAGLLAGAAGCGTTDCVADIGNAPASNSVPGGSQALPDGFHPLKGHADRSNSADFYGEYPRYVYSERDKMVMVYVPAQTITLGGGLALNEVPSRQVVVSHFYIDLHETTNLQFARFKQASDKATHRCPLCPSSPSCDALDLVSSDRWLLTGSSDGKHGHPGCCDREVTGLFAKYWKPCVNDNHPVRNVSWREAWHYSRWTGKDLPSEAQWEAAARGNDRRIYPWGNRDESEVTRYLCNHKTGRDDFDGYEFTAPVLSYAAGVSPFGAYNMAGNVWEWCGDWYDPGRYAYPSSEDPATGLERGPLPFGDRYYPNPWDKDAPDARVGPMRGDMRVIRGGSFVNAIEQCRVDSRSAAGPDVHQHNVGFRCVLPLPPKS